MSVTFEKFDLTKYRTCPIVTDGKIAKLYGISGDNVYLLPRGEKSKSFRHVQQLCRWFLSLNLNKSDLVVAVGGGSVGDTVGFAASIYKRGVRLLHVPTTLLAQIDSSIGGKTAIDLDGVKNAVGSYHFADTLIDVDFLKTLDKKQLTSGYGEILKYRMLNEEIDEVFKDCDLSQTVQACVRYKQQVCDVDPYCQNERNKLNFGHTVGHAMELIYVLPHGIAVANGIYYETLLAANMGICSREYAAKWMAEAEKFAILPLTDEIISLTLSDKKNVGGKVSFVLPKAFQQVSLTIEELEELKHA